MSRARETRGGSGDGTRLLDTGVRPAGDAGSHGAMVEAAGPWQASLTASELRAIREYTAGTRLLSANRKLRGHDAAELDLEERQLVEALDAALARSALARRMTLYRVVGHRLKSEMDAVSIGEIWRDPGYVSCSIHEEWAVERNAERDVLEIHAPAGSPGAYVANLTPQEGEEAHGEMILARGLQYRVRGRRREKERVVTELEVLPAGAVSREGVA